jgi:hypothetical protein
MTAKPKKPQKPPKPQTLKKPAKKSAAPVEKVRCTCQSATHGHRPGKCVSMTTESDRLCKFCHNMAAADAAKDPAKVIDPMNQPRSAR